MVVAVDAADAVAQSVKTTARGRMVAEVTEEVETTGERLAPKKASVVAADGAPPTAQSREVVAADARAIIKTERLRASDREAKTRSDPT